MKHTNEGVCPRCEAFLKDAHPTIREWFHKAKVVFPTLHTCRVWCGKEEQDKLVSERKSLLKWPYSKHNHTIRINGKDVPQSLAMDLFNLLENGEADFRIQYLVQIANWFEDQGAPLAWGGTWKKFYDGDHFEVKD